MSEKKNLDKKNSEQISGGSIDYNPDTGLYDVYDDVKDKVVQSFSNIKDAVKKDIKTNFQKK